MEVRSGWILGQAEDGNSMRGKSWMRLEVASRVLKRDWRCAGGVGSGMENEVGRFIFKMFSTQDLNNPGGQSGGGLH